jgi:phosphoribosylformylglycinamidine synthase
VCEAFAGVAPVVSLGSATDDGVLSLTVGAETLEYDAAAVAEMRDVIARTLN